MPRCQELEEEIMFDRTLWIAVALVAFLSVAATCENSARTPLVLTPQPGQLLRDSDSFVVEIEAPHLVPPNLVLEIPATVLQAVRTALHISNP